MSVMQQNRKNPILLGQDNNALTWLLIINLVLFAIIAFVKVIYYLEYDTPMERIQNFHLQITDWVSLPARVNMLYQRPWTVVTYMFAHEGLLGIIGTLLWLWSFGYIFQDLTGNTKIFPVYIYGGLAGALVFSLVSNLAPITNLEAEPLMGGGAAVMSLVVATTATAPRYKIFPMIKGGIPIWILAIIYITIDLVFLAGNNVSIAAGHLAGGLIGFIFILQMNRGYDMGAWMNRFYNWVNDLFNPEKKHTRKSVKYERFYKASRKPYEKTPRITQQKLDEILDKINQEGYDSLSDEEKDFLKKASQADI